MEKKLYESKINDRDGLSKELQKKFQEYLTIKDKIPSKNISIEKKIEYKATRVFDVSREHKRVEDIDKRLENIGIDYLGDIGCH